MNGAIYPLQYDVLNDFEPVGLLTSNSQMIIGRKSLPTNDTPSPLHPDRAQGQSEQGDGRDRGRR